MRMTSVVTDFGFLKSTFVSIRIACEQRVRLTVSIKDDLDNVSRQEVFDDIIKARPERADVNPLCIFIFLNMVNMVMQQTPQNKYKVHELATQKCGILML